jgi:hypothetical protein
MNLQNWFGLDLEACFMFLIDWNMGLSYMETSNARTDICFAEDKNALLLAPLRMLRCNTLIVEVMQ